MKFHTILLLALSLLFYSCSECEDSINLGEFKLSDASKNFVPYTGMDSMIFVDNNQIEHILRNTNGRNLEASRMTVRTICEEGFFDRTDMFFNTEREQISFLDSSGQQIFYIDLTTFFEDKDNLDSIAVYDHLYVSGNVAGRPMGEIRVITSEQQNQVSDMHKEDFIQHSRLIGDTTLYDRAFTDVFVDITGEGKGIYYNREKGVLAFKLSEEEFWVLKE